MLESNEIQESVEATEGSTEKVAEGFSHLTEADLNPDYKPESNAKEESAKTDSPAKAEEKKVEYKVNGTTYTDADLSTKMVKDYENLTSFTGKQAEDIGNFKSEINDLKMKIASLEAENEAFSKPQEPETSEPKTPEDVIFSKESIGKLIDDKVKAILDAKAEEQAKMQQKTQFEQTVERAGKKFVEDNPDYDENSMLDLVNKGKEKGIIFDSTNATEESVLGYLNLLNMAESKVKAASQTEKQPSDTAEKVKEASKVKSNLSDIGSTETDGRDYNDMSPMEWAKLPDNKRAELLGI